MNEVRKPCAFRDPSILNDDALAEKYSSELPEDFEPDSPEEEAIMVLVQRSRYSSFLIA